MAKNKISLWLAGACALLLILSIVLVTILATQSQVEEVECPVLEELVCPEPVVCEVCEEPVTGAEEPIDEVVEEEDEISPTDGELYELERSREVRTLFETELEDDDNRETLQSFFLDEYGEIVEDIDDFKSWDIKEFDIDWDDVEDGEATVEAVVKFEYEIEGDSDTHSKRVIFNCVLNDEDLEEFESCKLSDY